MSDEEQIKADPLFVGLTRPTLFFGVSQGFVMLNFLVCVVYFIQTPNVYIFPLAGTIHLVGYIASFKEPYIIELILLKLQNFNKCTNKLYHGANSYDMY